MWIWGSYLHLGSAITCLQEHKNRVKSILSFVGLGAWKFEMIPMPQEVSWTQERWELVMLPSFLAG